MIQSSISRSARRFIVGSLFVNHRLFSAALTASFAVIAITPVQSSDSKSAASMPGALALLAWAVTIYSIGWVMARAPPGKFGS